MQMQQTSNESMMQAMSTASAAISQQVNTTMATRNAPASGGNKFLKTRKMAACGMSGLPHARTHLIKPIWKATAEEPTKADKRIGLNSFCRDLRVRCGDVGCGCTPTTEAIDDHINCFWATPLDPKKAHRGISFLGQDRLRRGQAESLEEQQYLNETASNVTPDNLVSAQRGAIKPPTNFDKVMQLLKQHTIELRALFGEHCDLFIKTEAVRLHLSAGADTWRDAFFEKPDASAHLCWAITKDSHQFLSHMSTENELKVVDARGLPDPVLPESTLDALTTMLSCGLEFKFPDTPAEWLTKPKLPPPARPPQTRSTTSTKS